MSYRPEGRERPALAAPTQAWRVAQQIGWSVDQTLLGRFGSTLGGRR